MEDIQQRVRNYSNREWRLNNLYWITNEKAEKIQFRMNMIQRQLLREMWYLNLILKARQPGISTFVMLFMLDVCLFNSNIRAGVIAHNREDAEYLFEDKIKFAYDNLPDDVRASRPADTSSKHELKFNNNSSIRVGTSMRSGTLQYVHVSEYGKISKKYPEKAREIKTGTFNTVHVGQVIFVESTAEGQEGEFYELEKKARALRDSKKALTPLQFKHHFFPWWRDPKNRHDPEGVVVYAPLHKYFQTLLLKYKIRLTASQKAWYSLKEDVQGGDMKREFPSTEREAFETALLGAYFETEMTKLRLRGRITRVPHRPGALVDTWWDIGEDCTAIWFTQDFGREVHVIDYYENSGEGLPFYKSVLIEKEKDKELGYHYGRFGAPADLDDREWGVGAKRYATALQLGMKFDVAPKCKNKEDDINAARIMLPVCLFDEERCSDGIKALDSYRKEWDAKRGTYKDKPLHDWACHCADAFMVLSTTHDFRRSKGVARAIRRVSAGGWT